MSTAAHVADDKSADDESESDSCVNKNCNDKGTMLERTIVEVFSVGLIQIQFSHMENKN